MPSPSTLSRRPFFRSGSAVLALPWLETFSPATPLPAAPKRLVSICTGFDLYGPSFFPETAGFDYQPSEYLQILGPELLKKSTVFSGISHPDMGGDHASEACFLTSAKGPKSSNFRNTVSLDYAAAKHLGNVTRFPLMSLSTQNSGTLTHADNGAAVNALDKPWDIYKRMFLEGNEKAVENEVARLQRGQSILDQMSGNFSSLKNQLSRRDQQQVEDYATAVRSMERRLEASEAWVHKPKPKTDLPIPSDALDRSDTIGRLKTHLDLALLALQTDSTRIVSLFVKGMDERPPIDGITEGHHGLSHHGRNEKKIAQLKIIEKLEMEAYRDFLASLAATRDSHGSLLESTQVLLGSNLGDASSHNTSNLPILLAGGGWKHGSHIAGDRKENTPLAQLYVSILQKFGLETNTFGSGQGPIQGLA